MYVVNQATQKSSCLLGKGSSFFLGCYWSDPGNCIRVLPFCGTALHQTTKLTLFLFSPFFLPSRFPCFLNNYFPSSSLASFSFLCLIFHVLNLNHSFFWILNGESSRGLLTNDQAHLQCHLKLNHNQTGVVLSAGWRP